MGFEIAKNDGPGPDCLASFWFHAYSISVASSHRTAMAQPAIMGNSNLVWHESLYSTPSNARNPATLFVWRNIKDADQQSRGMQPPKPTCLTWLWCQSGIHGRSITSTTHGKAKCSSRLVLVTCSAQLEHEITWPNRGEGHFIHLGSCHCNFSSWAIHECRHLQIQKNADRYGIWSADWIVLAWNLLGGCVNVSSQI